MIDEKQRAKKNIAMAVILVIFALLIMLSSFRFWSHLVKIAIP